MLRQSIRPTEYILSATIADHNFASYINLLERKQIYNLVSEYLQLGQSAKSFCTDKQIKFLKFQY